MTNRDRVLAALMARPNEWLSGKALVDAGGGWRYGARIHELRQAGHIIEERPDPEHRTSVGQYRIVIPVEPVQTSLFGSEAAA